jgi:hypothetical protein
MSIIRTTEGSTSIGLLLPEVRYDRTECDSEWRKTGEKLIDGGALRRRVIGVA